MSSGTLLILAFILSIPQEQPPKIIKPTDEMLRRHLENVFKVDELIDAEFKNRKRVVRKQMEVEVSKTVYVEEKRSVPFCVPDPCRGLLQRRRTHIEYRDVVVCVPKQVLEKKTVTQELDIGYAMIDWADPKVAKSQPKSGTVEYTLPPTTGARLDLINQRLKARVPDGDREIQRVEGETLVIETIWQQNSNRTLEKKIRYECSVVNDRKDTITVIVKIQERSLPFGGKYEEYTLLNGSLAEAELAETLKSLGVTQ